MDHSLRLQHTPGLRQARRRAQWRMPPADSKCPPECFKRGVCNEELGRCDCPRSFEGPSCTTEVLDLDRVCTAYGYSKDR
jgi:hypothetical protein